MISLQELTGGLACERSSLFFAISCRFLRLRVDGSYEADVKPARTRACQRAGAAISGKPAMPAGRLRPAESVREVATRA